jgi:hypothetical protein
MAPVRDRIKLGMEVHACNPKRQRQENYKFKASLGYVWRPCVLLPPPPKKKVRPRELEKFEKMYKWKVGLGAWVKW